jgi:hypothetical protein
LWPEANHPQTPSVPETKRPPDFRDHGDTQQGHKIPGGSRPVGSAVRRRCPRGPAPPPEGHMPQPASARGCIKHPAAAASPAYQGDADDHPIAPTKPLRTSPQNTCVRTGSEGLSGGNWMVVRVSLVRRGCRCGRVDNKLAGRPWRQERILNTRTAQHPRGGESLLNRKGCIASSHMLVSKIKPCMSKYKQLVL